MKTFISGNQRPIKTQHEHIEQLRKKRKEKLKIKKIKHIKHNYTKNYLES